MLLFYFKSAYIQLSFNIFVCFSLMYGCNNESYFQQSCWIKVYRFIWMIENKFLLFLRRNKVSFDGEKRKKLFKRCNFHKKSSFYCYLLFTVYKRKKYFLQAGFGENFFFFKVLFSTSILIYKLLFSRIPFISRRKGSIIVTTLFYVYPGSIFVCVTSNCKI